MVEATFSRRFVEVATQARPALPEAVKGWLRGDCLQECCDELGEKTPSAGSGQAASAQRGESSNASTSGSSRRIAKR